MKTATRSASGVSATRIRLALAVTATLLAGSACIAAHAATSSMVSVARVTRLESGDAVVGALPLNQPIQVEVALKPRNQQALDAFIANIAKSQAQRQRPQLMTATRFLADHAPTQAQVQKVADYLTGMGYTHIAIAPNRLLISADGTAATARSAFMTSFAQVRTHDGRITYANTDEVRIPAALADTVLAVVGLQDVHRFHTFDEPVSASSSVDAGTMAAHNPMDFAWIYGATSPVAQQVPVGILTSGDLTQVQSALNTYASGNGMQPVIQSIVGANAPYGDPSHVKQWQLDSQAIVGMINGGPGANSGPAASLIFYNAVWLTDSDVTLDLNAIVASNQTKVVEASIGQCETDARDDGTAAAQDAILQMGMAQGQTFVVPAGNGVDNDGADQCPSGSPGNLTPSWPASSPYVVAVAGTDLSTFEAKWAEPKWNWETVWSNSGGSPSTFEPMPAWQSAFGVPGATRGVPDVAFAANQGATVVTASGGQVTKTGTSLSAALFAGTWARVLSAQGIATGPAGPIIYQLPAADFHDIRSGSNGGETAGPGYDFASGRGSMIIASAIADTGPLANKPPTASFQISQSYPLTLSLEDQSSDSDGTVAKYHWDFGDGSTSALASPTHLYVTGGTYTIVETVTDNDGATGQASQTIAVAAADQLLANPGVETQAAGWAMANGSGPLCQPYGDLVAFDGSCSVGIYNKKGAVETISQEVTIPSNKTQATLSFYLWIADEYNSPPATQATDLVKVQIRQPNGTLFKTLQTFSNLDGNQSCKPCAADYVRYSYDVSQWIGKKIKVEFFANEASGHYHSTEFLFDDITLIAQ